MASESPAVPAAQRPASRRAVTGTGAPCTAVVFATAPGEGGGPAAGLPWEGSTVLRRLLEQLESLGARVAHVVTRPGWEAALRPSLEGLRANLRVSPALADDLRLLAEVAGGGIDELVVVQGDVITHREALAGLLADPRIHSGILSTGGRTGRPFAPKVRAKRGRVISAASPFHHVHKPSGSFLGVLKVAAADRPVLAAQARALAGLAADHPASWDKELEARALRWRLSLARTTLAQAIAAGELPPREEPPDIEELERVELPAEAAAELGHRVAAAPQDATSLALVGLVRAGVHLGISHLRTLFWARPLSQARLQIAAEALPTFDEDRLTLDAAVKGTDGFFTTFFVSPYSKFIARWAAHRGLTPNQVTTFSLFVGALAAAAFAIGDRAGLIAGAVLLQLAFTFDCVDGQLARYTRQFSKLGAWLDSIFDRAKEYLVFAGLAIGAQRAGDPVWILAAAALTLQVTRHAFDFSFAVAQHQVIGATVQPPLDEAFDGQGPATPSVMPAADDSEIETPAPPPGEADADGRPLSARVLSLWRRLDRLGGIVWVKRMVAFPIGERFAAISLTAAIWSPAVTFEVLLAWGGLAACYTMAGRLLRTVAQR